MIDFYLKKLANHIGFGNEYIDYYDYVLIKINYKSLFYRRG